MRWTKNLLRSAMLLAAFLLPTQADEVVLLPSDDTAIYGGVGEENWNGGLSPRVPSGARGDRRDRAPFRMLIRFDIASQIPARSKVTKATLRLHIAQNPGNGGAAGSNFGFHRMLVPWIEGTVLAGNNGGGEVANAGEPTWINRAHPDTPWGTPGGLAGTDFLAAPKAIRPIFAGNSVNVIAAFEFDDLTRAGDPDDRGEVAEIQSMLDNPAANYGWMFLSDNETLAKTMRIFSTKDTLTQDAAALKNRPTLTVEYTPAPPAIPPSDLALTFAADGSRTLTFTRDAETTYEIESSASLLSSDWTAYGTVPMSPTAGQFSFPLTTPFTDRHFFRISAQ